MAAWNISGFRIPDYLTADKRFAKSFYSKTALQAVLCLFQQKRFAKSFYSKTALQAVLCLSR